MNLPNTLTALDQTGDTLKSELRAGTIPHQGINHPLHYVDHIPEVVIYKGSLKLELLNLDFIEVNLNGVGWVPLDHNVTLITDESQKEGVCPHCVGTLELPEMEDVPDYAIDRMALLICKYCHNGV